MSSRELAVPQKAKTSRRQPKVWCATAWVFADLLFERECISRKSRYSTAIPMVNAPQACPRLGA
jgi:hypothetical protein